MSVDSSPPSSQQAISILLIEDDPVFSLGLQIGLERFPDLHVLAAVDEGQAALAAIAQYTVVSSAEASEPAAPAASGMAGLDLVVLSEGLGRANPALIQGLELCRRINEQYPSLPILMVGRATEPIVWSAAQQVGARGYCLRTLDIEDLAGAIRRVAIGQSVWLVEDSARISTRLAREPQATSLTTQPTSGVRVSGTPPAQLQARSQLARSFRRWRRGLRVSGIQQIEAALADVEAQLQNLDLSLLERSVLAGQYRELRASRWLVNQLLRTAEVDLALPEIEQLPRPSPSVTSKGQTPPLPGTDRPFAEPAGIMPVDSSAQAIARLQSVVFDAVLAKLQSPLQNLTSTPLEIDILREERKRELFYLILRHIERLLDELRYSQVTPEQLAMKRSQLLVDLWDAVTSDFFGKYYTVALDAQPIEVVEALLGDRAMVQSEILETIPFTTELIAHFLFQTPLKIDGVECAVGNPAAVERAQTILEHWMIQIANGVMQPLLNRFSHVESIKYNLYDRRLMSNREIERFRNDLSWRYRLNTYFTEPQAIFESRYVLFAVRGRGIRQVSVYAPRTQELDRLSGIPFVVTLALETRDALAPRVRSVISLVGSSVVYVLTEVIGRGIGLIGRGILKGIGSSWQESRFNRNSGFPHDPDLRQDSEGQ